MKKACISMVQHLQRKLPLDSSFLEDLSCVNRFHKGKNSILNKIGCIIVTIPHIVTWIEISFLSFLFLLQPGNMTYQGQRKLFYGRRAEKKKCQLHGWPTTQNLKLYWLKWSKIIPKKKFGTEDKWLENSYLELSISSDFLVESLKQTKFNKKDH